MSQENVEIVWRIYTERLIDRDPKRLVDQLATPHIEYVDPAWGEALSRQRGRH
jgi:hypothetical protein